MDLVSTHLLLPGSFVLTALLCLPPADPGPPERRAVPEPSAPMASMTAARPFVEDPCTGCAAQAAGGVPSSAFQIVVYPSAWNNGQCSGTLPDCTPYACTLGGEIQIQNVSGATLEVIWALNDTQGSQHVLDTEHFYQILDGKNVQCGNEYRITIKNLAGQFVGSWVLACSACPS